MSTKDKVLKILIENKGNSVSGNEIAKQINVSKNAVWKAVCALKECGYTINSANNKGYALVFDDGKTKKEFVKQQFENYKNIPEIFAYDVIDSTNNEAKRLAEKGVSHGSLVCANSQVAGKGRLGRSFLSEGNGIYMTVVLRPEFEIEKTIKITSGAAVAVKRVLERYCGNVYIKWVNDVYIESKKVCGILTEAVSNFENGGVEYAVVGIGVNVFGKAKDFGLELENIVTTLQEHTNKTLNKNRLISEIYVELMKIYNQINEFDSVMDEYKKSSFVIGKDVFAIRGNEKKAVRVIDIDNNGALICVDEFENEIVFSSGEISIRFE